VINRGLQMQRPSLRALGWLGVAALMAALMAGCAATAPGPAASSALDGSVWTLPGGQRAPTLVFEAGRVSGSDGCNRFSGDYSASGSELRFGQRVSTQMACPLQDEAQLARMFGDALTQARGWRIDAGQLVLLDAAKAELMRLDAQPKTLAGTSWSVTGYNNGRQAVVGPIAGSTLRLQFMDDGRVAGFGGCNSFSGSWRLDGKNLSLGPLAATRKACPHPEGVMAQETALLRALESAASARREGPRLQLRTAADAMAASMTLDAAPKP
jgi:heat shock protein HslJ